MKISILALLFSATAFGLFSQFVQLTPNNIKGYKGEMKVKVVGDHVEFELIGINDHHAWLITTEKPIKEQVIFRSWLWNKKFESGKVVKTKKLYTNKDTAKHGVIPKFKVLKSEVDRTYLYMDSPVEIQDGGFYYTAYLKDFIPSKIDL